MESSDATLRRTIFQRVFVEIFFPRFVYWWVLCGPLAPPWGRVWSLLARLRPAGAAPIPSQYSQYFPWPFPPLMRAEPPAPPVSSSQLSPSPLLPPSLDTASQGESEHTPSQMCVRCLNPNIEKHSTFIIWVSEKFRTFNSLLQPPTLAEKKS